MGYDAFKQGVRSTQSTVRHFYKNYHGVRRFDGYGWQGVLKVRKMTKILRLLFVVEATSLEPSAKTVSHSANIHSKMIFPFIDPFSDLLLNAPDSRISPENWITRSSLRTGWLGGYLSVFAETKPASKNVESFIMNFFVIS